MDKFNYRTKLTHVCYPSKIKCIYSKTEKFTILISCDYKVGLNDSVLRLIYSSKLKRCLKINENKNKNFLLSCLLVQLFGVWMGISQEPRLLVSGQKCGLCLLIDGCYHKDKLHLG